MSENKPKINQELADAMRAIAETPIAKMTRGKLEVGDAPQEMKYLSNVLADHRHHEIVGMLAALTEKVDELHQHQVAPRSSQIITINCSASDAEDIARIVAEIEKVKGGRA